MSTAQHFIEPLDVLIMRGNKLFGDPGSYSESLIPPWPSAASGAIRSAMLANRGHDFRAFGKSEITSDKELGTPDNPGTFTLTRFQLARRDQHGKVEAIYPMPADLVVGKAVEDKQAAGKSDEDKLVINQLRPASLTNSTIESSNHTAYLPILPENQRSKPERGRWLNAEGWAKYIEGGTLDPEKHTIGTSELWTLETRIGVGLDDITRSAKTGQLFSLQAASLLKREHQTGQTHDIGFITEVCGATLPDEMTLRFGGDGRGALARRAKDVRSPVVDYDAIANNGRCKLVLSSPGLFANGWLPTGTSRHNDRWRFSLHGVEAEIVCAAIPRSETISGFDLATSSPKAAQRAVSTGAVYWLEHLQATPEALEELISQGLWLQSEESASRRAEGFNRLTIAAY